MSSIDIDAMFKGMADAEAGGRGGNTQPGLYQVDINDVFVKKGTNPKKPGDSFIVKFTFVESGVDAHAPGTSSSWVLKSTWPSWFGHATKFVYALLDAIDPDGGWDATEANLKDKAKRSTAEKFARAACGSETAKKELGELWQDGMFAGIRLKLETKMGTTASGGPFTEHYWSAPGTSQAEPAKLAA
jgi:hypothetical protein